MTVDRRIIDLYNEYVHTALPRRDFLHYAGSDERINAGIPEFRAALDAQGVPYSLNMYPGTQHGFHNDASAARYHEPAAKLAWSRTMDFFETYLKQ